MNHKFGAVKLAITGWSVGELVMVGTQVSLAIADGRRQEFDRVRRVWAHIRVIRGEKLNPAVLRDFLEPQRQANLVPTSRRK
jgi:hypothetical protein